MLWNDYASVTLTVEKKIPPKMSMPNKNLPSADGIELLPVMLYALWSSCFVSFRLAFVMSSGGHFAHSKFNSRASIYLPLLRRVGNRQIVPFLHQTSYRSTSNTTDLSIIPKPTDNPKVGSHIVHVVQIQTGNIAFLSISF